MALRSAAHRSPARRPRVLDVIARDSLLEKVHQTQRPVDRGVFEARDEFPNSSRACAGKGFLVGLQFASDTAPYQTALRERGLLVVGAGGNAIRVLPPLIATAEELARSVKSSGKS